MCMRYSVLSTGKNVLVEGMAAYTTLDMTFLLSCIFILLVLLCASKSWTIRFQMMCVKVGRTFYIGFFF